MLSKLAIYLISTLKKNEYKLGFHTGTINKLLMRYLTYYPNVVIHYFQYLDNARDIENIIKQKLYDYRVNNVNGRKSEIIKMPLEILRKHLDRIINNSNNIIVDTLNGFHYIPPKNNIETINKNIVHKKRSNSFIGKNSLAKYNSDIVLLFEEKYEKKNKWVEKKIYETLDILLSSKIKNLNSIDDFLNKKTQMKIKMLLHDEFGITISNKDFIKIVQDFTNKNTQMIIKKMLHNEFEITDDKNDFISVSEMNKFRSKHKKEFSTISNKRFNEIMRESFKMSQTRKGKACTRGWVGLKQKIEN